MTSCVDRTVLPYVLWTIFDQIFTRHCRHVEEYGIKFWRNVVKTPARSGHFYENYVFWAKINIKHFPDAVFNFYKQNDELATLTKMFSSKRRVVCTPYLPDLRKVEIFSFFAGHL